MTTLNFLWPSYEFTCIRYPHSLLPSSENRTGCSLSCWSSTPPPLLSSELDRLRPPQGFCLWSLPSNVFNLFLFVGSLPSSLNPSSPLPAEISLVWADSFSPCDSALPFPLLYSGKKFGCVCHTLGSTLSPSLYTQLPGIRFLTHCNCSCQDWEWFLPDF